MQANSSAREAEGRPDVRPRPNPWPALLFFGAFFAWMLVKQRLALAATGLKPGPYMTFASAGSLLALLPWLLPLRGRQRILAIWVLDLAVTVIIYGDVLYFRQFADLTSIASLRFAAQLTDVNGAVSALVRPADLTLWYDLLVIPLLMMLPRLLREPLFGSAWRWRKAAVASLAGIVIVAGCFTFDPVMRDKYYGHSMYGSRLGLLTYHAVDLASYAGRLSMRVLPSGTAVAEVNKWIGPRRAQAASPNQAFAGIARGKNVIMIQVESLQAFTIGLKVGGQEVTPNLNRIAGESLYFPDFYSQTGQGVTSDADLLTNCSLFPTRTGAVYYDYAANDFRCMPTLLREHGYHAIAAQGMPPDFWNLGTIYPRVGFERYFSARDHDMSDKLGIGLSDRSFLRQSLTRLKGLPQPYYAFLVTLTSHGPFDFPGIPHELNLGPLEGTVAGAYLHAVHYTDKAIGEFYDSLKAEGLLENAVVVIYGDHGGVFRQGSGMQELLGYPQDDWVHWTQVEKRVPLILRIPGGPKGQQWTRPAGQSDTAPTLAALLGIPTDSVYFMGRDIFAQEGGPISFYDGAATDAEHLFLATGVCYDRATGAKIDVAACSGLAESAANQLAVSRSVVQRNLISALTKKR